MLVGILSTIRLHHLDNSDVVAFKHDAPQRSSVHRFNVQFLSIIQHQVHVLIEADNVALNSEPHVLVEPHLHSGSVLQVSEDQVDGLHHHFLHFLRFISHRECILWQATRLFTSKLRLDFAAFVNCA